MADRIVVMNKAQIMQSGTPEEIYEQPRNRFVADFIGAINFIAHKTSAPNLLAVRPENISISAVNSANAMAAELKHIEFRGNFCRILAQPLADEPPLFIDLPWKQAKALSLRHGSMVFLQIEQSSMLKFNERGNMVC